MSDYYATGFDDAKRAQFYGYGLPCGTSANSETRATYRAGWIVERASRGLENLPACFMSLGNRHYWIVSLTHDRKPVFNVTTGSRPDNAAGYYNLAALMELKGDDFAI